MRPIASIYLRLVLTCLSVLAIACDSNSQTSVARDTVCPEASPHTPHGESPVAAIDDHDFTGGITRIPGGFAGLDLRSGQVVLLDNAGMRRRAFGRTGQGPLEFQPFAYSERLLIRHAQWIEARGAQLVVFDGRRLLFGDTLGFRQAVDVPTGVVTGFNQVHQVRWLDDESVVLAYERAPSWEAARGDQGTFEVLRVRLRDGEATPWARFRTLEWPRNAIGRVGRGLAEAQPRLAMRGTCVVYSDGHSDSLWIVDKERGDSLALPVAFPRRFAEDLSEAEYRRLGVPEGAMLPVRHPARIAGMAFDTGGHVWLRPAAPRYRGEVWRLDAGMRTVVSDTLITPFHMMPFR